MWLPIHAWNMLIHISTSCPNGSIKTLKKNFQTQLKHIIISAIITSWYNCYTSDTVSVGYSPLLHWKHILEILCKQLKTPNIYLFSLIHLLLHLDQLSYSSVKGDLPISLRWWLFTYSGIFYCFDIFQYQVEVPRFCHRISSCNHTK